MDSPLAASRISSHRQRAVIHALLVASAICLLLLIVRAIWTREIQWTGFFGNLLLAWIPLLFSSLLCWQLDYPGRRRWLMGTFFVLWLLFFPNAAYIVTDLVHLKGRDPVPRWFDWILITAYAWTGLFLAYVSLTLLHLRVRAFYGSRAGWSFVALMLVLGSFGIYVGRFFRWNSWDVFVRPWRPAGDLIKMVEFPTLRHVAGFCTAFFLLSVLVYVVLHAIAHLHAPPANRTNGSGSDEGIAQS